MRTVREWKNKAGDVVGVVHEGVLVRMGTDSTCPSYAFDTADLEWNHPFRALVYCDADVEPVDGGRCPFGQFLTTEVEAIAYVKGHIPLANTKVRLTNRGAVARIEAWQTRGAIHYKARARVLRMDKRLLERQRGATKCLLVDADLSHGFTFDLLIAAYDWRSYGALTIKDYLSHPNEWNLKDVRRAIAWYRMLTADSTPALLQKNAREWLKWQDIPDPLSLTLPPV